MLVVEVETKKKDIRIMSGYGPQENWEEEKRLPFFVALETEIEKSELAGKSIVIELDANSKLGKWNLNWNTTSDILNSVSKNPLVVF